MELALTMLGTVLIFGLVGATLYAMVIQWLDRVGPPCNEDEDPFNDEDPV